MITIWTRYEISISNVKLEMIISLRLMFWKALKRQNNSLL